MLMKLTLGVNFTYMFITLLFCPQIPKAQIDSQVISVFLRFWDLSVQKLLVKCL